MEPARQGRPELQGEAAGGLRVARPRPLARAASRWFERLYRRLKNEVHRLRPHHRGSEALCTTLYSNLFMAEIRGFSMFFTSKRVIARRFRPRLERKSSGNP